MRRGNVQISFRPNLRVLKLFSDALASHSIFLAQGRIIGHVYARLMGSSVCHFLTTLRRPCNYNECVEITIVGLICTKWGGYPGVSCEMILLLFIMSDFVSRYIRS